MLLRTTFLLVFCTVHLSRAQNDSFSRCLDLATARTYAGYFNTRACLYKRLRSADTLEAKAVINSLHAEAKRASDTRLDLYARDAYIEFVLRRRSTIPLDSILLQRRALVESAKRLGEEAYLIWTEQNLANALYVLAHQHDDAFEIHARVYRNLQRYSDAEIPDRRNFLGSIGHHYYEFAEYRQAIRFLSEAVEGSQPTADNSYDWRQAYNTLGLCYRELGRYDSSDYYFNKTLRSAVNRNNHIWASIARGNLGINLYRRGRFGEAEPLLAEDLRLSAERKDWNNAAGATSTRGYCTGDRQGTRGIGDARHRAFIHWPQQPSH